MGLLYIDIFYGTGEIQYQLTTYEYFVNESIIFFCVQNGCLHSFLLTYPFRYEYKHIGFHS